MNKFEKIVSLCKRRGFIFQTSEIYGGLANSYDYGPLGAELLRNIRNLWWKEFVTSRMDMVGIDTQIILHPETWVASGHVSGLTDPLVEDIETHKRYRADHLIEAYCDKNGITDLVVDDLSTEQMDEYIKANSIKSPDGNDLSDAKDFNLLFETALGVVSGEKSKAYLRGETAQGIFTNFKNVVDSSRVKLPFGVGQLGKSFRNEITTGQFIFRTLEFEQAEIEYFFNPKTTDWEKLFKTWQNAMWSFLVNTLGIQEENLRWREQTEKERAHYSKSSFDIDYKFPFGFKELWGLAYRTDYDLKAHQVHSSKKLEYIDPSTNERFLPHVIEPALGIGRTLFMVLADAYTEEENRTYLNLSAKLAPYKLAVFPLVKNKENIVNKAKDVFSSLAGDYASYWDDRGNIGKRYAYQDEIGTPFCITIDYETLDDDTVTVRDRDTQVQERVAIKDLNNWLSKKIKNYK